MLDQVILMLEVQMEDPVVAVDLITQEDMLLVVVPLIKVMQVVLEPTMEIIVVVAVVVLALQV